MKKISCHLGESQKDVLAELNNGKFIVETTNFGGKGRMSLNYCLAIIENNKKVYCEKTIEKQVAWDLMALDLIDVIPDLGAEIIKFYGKT